MKLDDLRLLYNDAYHQAYNPAAYHLDKEDLKAQRAGIRAVVEALRDEMRREWFLDDSGLEAVERWMNEILASDGEEAAR
jgi:hypothetical protein